MLTHAVASSISTRLLVVAHNVSYQRELPGLLRSYSNGRLVLVKATVTH